MNFFPKTNEYDMSGAYGRMEEVEIQQMSWNSCNTVLINLKEVEMNKDKTSVEIEQGVNLSDVISLLGPYRTNCFTKVFDNSLVCEEVQYGSTIQDYNSYRDTTVSTKCKKREVPIITISPPSPEDGNDTYFEPRSEDKLYLKIPPKPFKGDYYGIKFWTKCDNMNCNSNSLCQSKDLVLPNENIIQLLQEEEQKVCNINRVHYTRGAKNSFTKLYSKFCYKYNTQFNKNLPYRTEFLRYSQDLRGEVNLYSKCGLCPFCPCIVFKNMETTEYYDHLSLIHGITKNNLLMPNPRYFGLYKFIKDGVVYHHQGVTCTLCGDVLKINKSKSLYNYMKHYRDAHT